MKYTMRWVLLVTLALASAPALGQGNPIYAWTNFAGMPGGGGSADGTGPVARFQSPEHVAVGATGDLFVADYDNGTIRKATLVGTNLVVTTIAGAPRNFGSADGTNNTASFYGPGSVAVAGDGSLYVADTWNHTIRKVTPVGSDWVVTTIAGLSGTSGTADGTNSDARFNVPNGVAVDNAGNVFVADLLNHAIRQIRPVGTNWVVTTIAGWIGHAGKRDGTNNNASFNKPSRLALDGSGNLFVADEVNNTIRKVTPIGTNWVVTTIAGDPYSFGSKDGTNNAAQFNSPTCVAVDAGGTLFVADYSNYLIRKATPVGTNWVVTTVAGLAGSGGSADGTNSAARFYHAEGVAVAADGSLYVADTWNQTIRRITSSGTNWVVTTVAGAPDHRGAADGTNSAAQFYNPRGVAADGAGNLVVADTSNHTLRRVTAAGAVTTLAGSPGAAGGTDGTGSAARFNYPYGVAVDGAGNIFVADSSGATIRSVTPGGDVTTIAGSYGVTGSADGDGSTARFNGPYGIAIDSAGALYVADYWNDTIRKLTPEATTWTVSTLAGSPGVAGTNDGVGGLAQFNGPCGLAVDSAANVFVADTSNHTIRQITPDGVVSTLAGSPGQAGAVDGTGSAARFNSPAALVVDGVGNIFVADSANDLIRKVTAAGLVTTIGGRVGVGSFLEGLGTSAIIGVPYGIALDSAGNLYVADWQNSCIIKGLAAYPRISLGLVGSQLQLSWPSNCLGWQLQAQTNLPGSGQSSGWTTLPGSTTTTQMTVQVESAVPSMFYRLSP